jgi:hypothetical protein
MTLYKHGVGYFQRRGAAEGEEVKLTFRREEMDDLLKSLTVIDHTTGGQVRGVDYDTPQSLAERLAGCSIILDERRSLRDLVVALRGRSVQLQVKDGSLKTGTLLGLDEDPAKPLELSQVSILLVDTQTVSLLPLKQLSGVTIQDSTAAADLRFFLQTALGQETHRSITIRLNPGPHDLEVGYIAPAPTWRVSYRLVTGELAATPQALLQGWGIFDNRLEEDLNDISLSLTAGMPISFIYDLYTPHTPTRPVVEEENRTITGPIMFEGAVMAEEEAMPDEFLRGAAPPPPAPMMAAAPAAPGRFRPSAKKMAASVQSAATGQAMGELFQYNVSAPVTVGRGQSAMVPIVSTMLTVKKDLIYNGAKMSTHPVATIRFNNLTGLTLERGPVTVLENGEYVGEAILPFTADKAETVISYAVELGIHVKEEITTESRLQSLHVKEGYLLQNIYDIRRKIYQVDNRTPKSRSVLIEHVIADGYTIFGTPDPVEKTLETHRYQVETLPGKITTFTIQERFLRSRHEKLQDLSYQGLQKYFKDKLLDEAAYNDLKGLLDKWQEISQLKNGIGDQERRRMAIYQAQEQTRKNMNALSPEGEEGQLRGRYVKQLTASEEELAQIERTIARIQADIERKQTEIEQMIAVLAGGAR